MAAKQSNGLVSLLAAVVVGVTGLIPVIWLLTTPEADSVVAEETVVEQATTTAPVATTLIYEAVPTLDVDELDPAITRVLQANGYADVALESDVEAQLSPAVTRVLIDHNAVLAVVEDGAPGGEG